MEQLIFKILFAIEMVHRDQERSTFEPVCCIEIDIHSESAERGSKIKTANKLSLGAASRKVECRLS